MLLSRCPIIAQLVSVNLRPIEHDPRARRGSFPSITFQRLYRDSHFMLPVDRVEVRRRVIVLLHPNDDSEKDAERWHSQLILLCLFFKYKTLVGDQ